MRLLLSYLPFALWTLLILVACFMNPAQLPSLDFEFIFGPDKFVHFSLFGMQSFLLSGAMKREQHKPLWIAPLLCSVLGIGIEFVQGYMLTYRSFDYADMLANALGAYAFWFIWKALRRNFFKQ